MQAHGFVDDVRGLVGLPPPLRADGVLVVAPAEDAFVVRIREALKHLLALIQAADRSDCAVMHRAHS